MSGREAGSSYSCGIFIIWAPGALFYAPLAARNVTAAAQRNHSATPAANNQSLRVSKSSVVRAPEPFDRFE
jgi:hypothetical protein